MLLGAIGVMTFGACAPSAARPASVTPLVTDRPDFTESPSVVGPRRAQVEAGNTYGRTGDVVANTLGETLLRVGVTERSELRVALSSWTRAVPGSGVGAPVSGWEDANLGAKFSLVADARGAVPATSLIVGTSVPVGSHAFRRAAAEPEAKLLLAWTMGEQWSLSSNLNYALLANPAGGRVAEPSASLSVGRSLTDRLGSYLETYAFRPVGGDGTQFVNAGMTLLLSDDLQLDARAGSGVGANRRDYFVGLGVARRW